MKLSPAIFYPRTYSMQLPTENTRTYIHMYVYTCIYTRHPACIYDQRIKNPASQKFLLVSFDIDGSRVIKRNTLMKRGRNGVEPGVKEEEKKRETNEEKVWWASRYIVESVGSEHPNRGRCSHTWTTSSVSPSCTCVCVCTRIIVPFSSRGLAIERRNRPYRNQDLFN